MHVFMENEWSGRAGQGKNSSHQEDYLLRWRTFHDENLLESDGKVHHKTLTLNKADSYKGIRAESTTVL